LTREAKEMQAFRRSSFFQSITLVNMVVVVQPKNRPNNNYQLEEEKTVPAIAIFFLSARN
jgi:hypothetical protein